MNVLRPLAVSLLSVLLLALPGAYAEDDLDGPDHLTWARGVLKERLADAQAVAPFPEGRQWLNVSRPLTWAKELRGKVVVLDFWCYCCINCIHVLPDLEYLEEKYADQPFAVVGVHSAKFDNEKDVDNIREAVRRYEIKHPVVNDADFKIWRAFSARSWPTFAVVMPDGRLLGTLAGEGRRGELDALVQAALEHYQKTDPKLLDKTPLPIQLEAARRQPGALAYPGKVLVDPARDSLYIADSNHNRIVEVGRDGTFKRAWGDGERGLVDGGVLGADGPATRFFRPQGMALWSGALWVADTENHAIRAIDLKSGRVRTVAGDGTQGRDRSGSMPAKAAKLNSPWDVLWVKDKLVIAMAGNHQLWRYDPKHDRIEHFAGDGTERRLDAATLQRAAFAQPSGLVYDGKVLYVADSESSSIVVVEPEGGVMTLAGANRNPRDLFHFGDEDGKGYGRRFQHCLGVALVGDLLYVADSYNHKIKTVALTGDARGEVATFLGDATAGAQDDPARFSEPGGLSADGDVLYVADTNNHAIRVIDTKSKKVRTLALKGVPIPQMHARTEGSGDDWPAPNAVGLPYGSGVRAVPDDEPWVILLHITWPEGWKLTPDAPSRLRLEYPGGKTDLRFQEAPWDMPAPKNTAFVKIPGPTLPRGAADMRLRIVYYLCEDAGTCQMRSRDFNLRFDVGDGPERPAEAGTVTSVVMDTFEPPKHAALGPDLGK